MSPGRQGRRHPSAETKVVSMFDQNKVLPFFAILLFLKTLLDSGIWVDVRLSTVIEKKTTKLHNSLTCSIFDLQVTSDFTSEEIGLA